MAESGVGFKIKEPHYLNGYRLQYIIVAFAIRCKCVRYIYLWIGICFYADIDNSFESRCCGSSYSICYRKEATGSFTNALLNQKEASMYTLLHKQGIFLQTFRVRH